MLIQSGLAHQGHPNFGQVPAPLLYFVSLLVLSSLIFAAGIELRDVSAVINRMCCVGDEIFTTESRANVADSYPPTSAQVGKPNAGAAGFDKVLSDLEQKC